VKIKKYYKFYYGHRNQELLDKCHRFHGHIGQFFVIFNVKRDGNISTLFNDFDSVIEPWIKNNFDHRTLLDINDTLYETFLHHKERTGEDLGAHVLPFASSVENVSFYFYHWLTRKFNFDVYELHFQETTTSTLIYNEEDYQLDIKSDLGEKINLCL